MKKQLLRFLFLPIGIVSVCGLPGLYAQSPGGVTGSNTIWLKANTGVTLSPTNTVTTWAEQSGSAITGDFSTQGAAINKPAHQPPNFQANGINFNPYILFNNVAGVENSISAGNATTGLQILDGTLCTMFQVIKLHTMTGTGVWCKWQWATNPYSGPRLGNEWNPSNAGQIRFDFRTNTPTTASFYGATNIFEKHTLSTMEATAAQKSIRFIGAPDGTMATTGTFAPGANTSRITLGAEPYGDNYPSKVDIAEFILYKRSLTALERNQVESYLAVKYGMTLLQTGTNGNDYTNAVGAVIWNRTANAPYINNITGIGRDDASGLNQKQSLSINNRAMVTMYNGTFAGGAFPATNELNGINFPNDQHYIIFGDNLADTLVTHCSPDGRFSKMARTWKVQVSGAGGAAPVGSSGTLTLALKKANVPPQITSLIIANDPNFTTGLSFIPMQDNGTDLYAEVASLTNGQYFTFGTAAMELNGVVTPVLCFPNTGGVTLSPTGGVLPATYSWNSNPVQATQNLSGVNNGNYTVTVNQANGCTFSETFSVTGNPTPIFLKVRDTANTICTADNGMIEVSGIGGTPSYSYGIDGGPYSSVNRFNNLAPGVHTISIKDQNGCMNDTTVSLANYVYTLNTEVDTASAWCDAGGLGGEVVITVNGGNEPYGYFWNNNPPDGKGPKMLNLPKGTYVVTVTDLYGCVGTATGIVNENSCCFINIPNAFSPNGDNTNDKFVSVSNRPIPKYEMAIYDRWGKRIFYTTKYDEGWDGTYQNNGTALGVGTYFYKINYTCERGNKKMVFQGDLTLIR